MAKQRNRRSLSPEESQPRSEYWRAQSEAWQSSGKTQADFCEDHDLSLTAFRWWRWKLKKEAATAPAEANGQRMRLVPIRVVDLQARSPPPLSCPASSDRPSAFEVLLESGTCLRVPRDFDAEALCSLLRTLEAAGC